MYNIIIDYSEERVAVLLNADLANTLGNLLQRLTSDKLNPDSIRDVKPSTAQQEQLESEWNKISDNKKDRVLLNCLKNLTGGHYYNNIIITFAGSSLTTCLNPDRNSW